MKVPDRFALFLLLLLLGSNGIAQQVTGLWQGNFRSSTLPQTGRYSYEVLLFQNGTNLTGFTYSGNGSFYAVCELKGKVYETHMVITETRNVVPAGPVQGEIKQQHILFFQDAEDDEVTGEWRQINRVPFQVRPEQGTTFLRRATEAEQSPLLQVLRRLGRVATEPAVPPQSTAKESNPADDPRLRERPLLFRDTVSVQGDTLRFRLFDDGVTDGDRVTVLVNGVVLLQNAELGAQPQEWVLYWPAGQSQVEIVFYAENEGRIPPNTGLLRINDGRQQHELRFRSDRQTSAGVVLRKQ
ncbi:MAG TPA: hypothetical protein PKE63_14250 [Lacibacter sp.]|nr:hypothetical protein [Lacibacter sp.]HMO90138.1 hypothetical protein [Lacibacter sp.]HMP88437.1 hypothetical protein [Lacibacter sp.]